MTEPSSIAERDPKSAMPTTNRPPATDPPGIRAEPDGERPTREALLAAHAAARRRRNAAPLGSAEWVDAVAEIARIEVAIAELDRTADPPRL